MNVHVQPFNRSTGHRSTGQTEAFLILADWPVDRLTG